MRPYLKSLPGQLPQTLAAVLGRDTAQAPVPTSAASRVASSDEIASSDDDDVIDVKGVARLLHVGRNKLYEMVARNQIPHRRFGRCIRFSRAAVMRWLDSCWLQDAKERQ